MSFLVVLSKREYCLMSAAKRVFCSAVATAPLKQASSSPTVMPVGGILERTSSPVGKGAVWVSAGGGGGEGPAGEGWVVSCGVLEGKGWGFEGGRKGMEWEGRQ